MGHSQAEKAESHERILDAAAAEIRDSGLEALSVGKLMKKVNLTHGGFYGHFSSRSDLIAQALERALSDGERAARASSDPGKVRTFSMMVRSYLSRAHRDSRRSGCAIAALISDVGRADERSRAVMARHVEGYIGKVGQEIGDEEAAITAVSALIGALAISRLMTDPRRSDAILKTVREHLLARLGEGNAGRRA